MKLMMETLLEGLPKGAQQRAGQPGVGWRAVSRQIMVLHENYTGKSREFRHEKNPIHSHLEGYQLYFFPRNLLRVLHVLEALPWAAGQPGPEPVVGDVLRLLDLGAGSGAFSLGVLCFLADRRGPEPLPRKIQLTLVDQGRNLLNIAEGNIRRFGAAALPEVELEVKTVSDGMERYLSNPGETHPFDVIGGAMMLNEVNLLGSRRTTGRATRFGATLRKLGTSGSLMVFVEPGTRKGFMNLNVLRDQFVGERLLYPCPHGRPCPMYSPAVRRWCHGTLGVPSQFFFDWALRKEGRLEFEMKELNLSGLAFQLRRSDKGTVDFEKRDGGRVVSGWMPVRQKKKSSPGQGAEAEPDKIVLVCQPDGLLTELSPAHLSGNPRGQWLSAEQGGIAEKKGSREWKKRR